MQTVIFNDHFILKNFDLSLNDINETFIFENIELNLKLKDLEKHFLIHFDRDYTEETNIENVYFDDQYFIRKVLNFKDNKVRSFCQMHQTRKKLKIKHFDKEQLAKAFNRFHISFLYLLFIDDFKIHRNMYRALKAFYFIFACLFYFERRKMINVFILTLKSYETQLKDVVEVFRKSLKKLNIELKMNINDQDHIVCAFVMTFLKNMSQQANNDEFFRHNAKRNCRTCFCLKSEKKNLEYDIINNDKYHLITKRNRESAQYFLKKNQKLFVQNTDIKIDTSFIISLTSVLNIILFRAYNASHFK